jgi:outer membrane protein OmpA-like peptidoglycan-associated protein
MKLQHSTPPLRSRTLGALSLLAAAAVLALSACGSAPRNNDQVDAARSAYNAAAANPEVRDGAPVELKAAADALNRAEQSLRREEKTATVNNLAYLASQSVATAQAAGSRKASEAAVAKANAERDRMRLEARTKEADAATASAQAAQVDARASQVQARSAERDALASQRAADASQQDAQAALQRNLVLEEQLRDLNAKKTSRGMVITIGDVLFDTGRAEIKSGGMRNMDKLVSFLQTYPLRRAQVEGFTDNVGSDSTNQDLSARRADAVRSALVSRGIAADRVGTQGYGESFPVAGNDSAGGRQMNRRVEIVLSDDSGVIASR